MTQQLDIWKSAFGEEWAKRNTNSQENINKRKMMFEMIFSKAEDLQKLTSVLEIGASIGTNLIALHELTNANLFATEPNDFAFGELQKIPFLPKTNMTQETIFNMQFEDASMDLVFTSGVLIHVTPDDLIKATSEIVRISKKYVLCIEYFAHEPESIVYRGHKDLLFKRDFGSFYLDNHPELSIQDYGFLWQPATGLGNMTWFLLKKQT